MKCFKCSLTFTSTNHLILHLRRSHFLQENDNYLCTNDECYRFYSSLNSYRKHLNSMHTKLNSILSDTPNLEDIPHDHSVDSTSGSDEAEINTPFLDTLIEDSITSEKIDLDEFVNSEIISFILTLYNEKSLSRKSVQMILTNVSSLLNTCLIPSLREKINVKLQLIDNDNSLEILNKINSVLDDFGNPFRNLDTEYKRFKNLEKFSYYCPPEDFVIGQARVAKRINNEIYDKVINVTGKFISLKKTLNMVLEAPGLFDEIKNYIDQLKSDQFSLRNVIQGSVWKSLLPEFGDKFFLPLYVFFDDYETGNALGAHAGSNKLGGVYTSIACMPPKYASSVNSIFLTQLFYSDDRKSFGNKAIFDVLINELNDLHDDGIIIKTGDREQTVYFQCITLLGDNLGQNSMLGFVESFSSNFYCRICKASKEQCLLLCQEDFRLLRTPENYATDVSLADQRITGIKESSVWNRLKGFHVCRNVSVDIMHDLYEGICPYVMTEVLNYFLFKREALTLEVLNSRLRLFDFGKLESSNKPPQFSLDNSKKIRWKMSASESLCFTRIFALLIGDLVDKNDPVWQLYLKLRVIIHLITSPVITRETLILLYSLIVQQNALYLQLFEENLKPKFHIFTHYIRIILSFGPPIHFSSMRYESKHRDGKMAVNVSCNRTNVIQTISIKNQLRASAFWKNFTCSQDLKIGPQKNVSYFIIDNYFNNVKPKNSISTVSWVSISGTSYEVNSVIVLEKKDLPVFGIINYICMVGLKVYFIVCKLITNYFDNHYFAYEVTKTAEMVSICYDNLASPEQCLLVDKIKKIYVSSRYIL